MKTLLLLLLLTGESHCTDSANVYICDSPGARKYHLRQNCKGLRNCQHRVIQITLEQAKRKGRTLCVLEK